MQVRVAPQVSGGVAAFRIVSGVLMAPIFLLSLVVRYNDPDPVRWMLIYGAAAVLCIAIAVNRPRETRRIALAEWAIAAVGGMWAAIRSPSLPAFLGSDHQPTTFYTHTGDALEEEARECGGLLIVTAWSLVVAFSARKHAARASAR